MQVQRTWKLKIFSYCGPLIDTSVCLGAFPTSGAVLEWFMREILDDCSPAAYDMMWKHAEFRGDSSLMFNPHFSGNLGGIYGLGLTKTKEDLFESMIESLTFESRRILEGCKKIKKGSCDKVWVGGGAARSEKWMQLRADIWGCRVERMQNIEVSSVGAALLAAVKVELYQDIKSAARSMLHIRDSYEPSKDISDRYELKYRQYLELVSNGIKTGGRFSMKKSGIINAELMKALTLARHGHMITICDAGFPIPKGEDIIDLSLTAGIPSFFDTLKAVLNEIIVEKFIVVDHMEIYNPQGLQQVQKMMIKQEQEIWILSCS